MKKLSLLKPTYSHDEMYTKDTHRLLMTCTRNIRNHDEMELLHMYVQP